MNNKEIMRSFSLVLSFGILFIVVFFMAIFLQDIGRTEILDSIDNYTTNSETQLGISEQMKTHIHSLPQEYSDTSIPYDLFFIIAFFSMYTTALYSAFNAKENNMFRFFGILYIGMIGFLFVTGIMTLIVNWFSENLITGFIGFDLTTTPIINFYLTNMPLINFALGLILILVNKLTFTNKREDDNDLINSEIGRFG